MNIHKENVLDVRTGLDFTSTDVGRDAVLSFSNNYLHYDSEHRYEQDFYGRRLRPHVLKHLDFGKPLNFSQARNYEALAANRVLYTMHELDFLMLPSDSTFDVNAFTEFYSPGRRSTASIGISYLERFLFSFLSDEIRLSGNWSLGRVKEYFESQIQLMSECTDLPSANAIREAPDPGAAARDFLIQLAPDFLIESSPMARYASGSFGELGSQMFKIIIDELGYGNHATKHSTLFENTLRSVGLDSTPHHYWQYYLNGSLMLANFYNLLTRDKRNVFRYIGAIFLAETGFITSCKIWRDTIKAALPSADIRYFDEHCHIDKDHSRMALEGLVVPAIERYGATAAMEIVRGYEEARLLGDFAEEDFVAQIAWKTSALANRECHRKIIKNVDTAALGREVKMATFVEPTGELSITHTHDEEELCHVVSGSMEFLNGFESSSILNPGEGIVIRKNRLHGALILAGPCEYRIYNIKDASKWQ
jgi:quercetin dioxygenase-like cupin family protein